MKAYERPSRAGSLVIPDSFRTDKSWSLWEVVKSSPSADEDLCVELGENDIVKTKVVPGVDTGLDDERDGRRLFFITPDVIQDVRTCTWEVA